MPLRGHQLSLIPDVEPYWIENPLLAPEGTNMAIETIDTVEGDYRQSQGQNKPLYAILPGCLVSGKQEDGRVVTGRYRGRHPERTAYSVLDNLEDCDLTNATVLTSSLVLIKPPGLAPTVPKRPMELQRIRREAGSGDPGSDA